MSFSDFVTPCGKRVNKEHFIHLVQVSRADGKILPAELELLHKEGRKFGLTDPEIDRIIEEESKRHYDPPYSLNEKFNQLYNIVEMILADDNVSEGEMKLINRYAIEAGFTDKTIPKLIDLLIKGVREDKDEEILLKEFRKKHLFAD
ncbi:MAG: hypothetical protein GYA41_01220 [Bacteroidales bacterium]|nr:hypothetical protein [Bacteroidales bacterium]